MKVVSAATLLIAGTLALTGCDNTTINTTILITIPTTIPSDRHIYTSPNPPNKQKIRQPASALKKKKNKKNISIAQEY